MPQIRCVRTVAFEGVTDIRPLREDVRGGCLGVQNPKIMQKIPYLLVENTAEEMSAGLDKALEAALARF
jgi:hypothetical protein